LTYPSKYDVAREELLRELSGIRTAGLNWIEEKLGRKVLVLASMLGQSL